MRAALATSRPATAEDEHPNALAIGLKLGEYRIERVLGAGGFGITYLAWDRHLEKHVAIKEYLPAALAVRALDGSVVPVATHRKHDYAWGLDRFVKEARTLARFTHPHIVRVNRYFEASGTAYMVMDYEAGVPLSAWLRRHPRPDEAQLRAIVLPLLDGLEAVHAQGFLHRDIKPSNIFLRENGTPVLIDFGSARQANGNQTRTLTSIVSPGYAPLEQYSSDGNQGPWTDIYSLSAVLYRAMLAENPPDAAARVQKDPLAGRLAEAAARYSAAFVNAVRWGLAVDERRRPQSVAQWRPVFQGEALPCDAMPAPPPARPVVPISAQLPSAMPARATTTTTVPASHRFAPAADAGIHAMQPPPMMKWLGIGLVAVAVAGLGLRQSGSNATGAVQGPRAVAVQAAAGEVPVAVSDQFQEIDADRDGAISRTEAAGRAPRLAGAFDAVDVNRDGSISPPELKAFVQVGTGFLRPKPRPDLPAAAGAVGTGSIDAGMPDPGRGAPFLPRDFEIADSDGDGFLGMEEARQRLPFVAKNFAQMDANGDGRVSREEVARFQRLARDRGARP
jgi:serine/threonine protein kinase